MSQGLFGVTRLTAPSEEIAELVEADGDVARPPPSPGSASGALR